MIRLVAAIWLVLPSLVAAQTLAFPSNASMTRDASSQLESYAFPIAPWDGDGVPLQTIEGALTQQAWRIETSSLTALQMMRPLREQLRNDRFEIVFECADAACGGFDFRFAIDVLPPPEMQIALGDFRYLTAQRGGVDGKAMLSLLVSRTPQAGFVQVTRIAPTEAEPLVPMIAQETVRPPEASTDLATQLDAVGRAVLDDLSFETGSAQLSLGEFASLKALSAYMQANPSLRIMLVGHTDASGDLAPNIALSQRRAASVLERMVTDYGVARSQLAAEGAGFLVPLANNTSEEGRRVNRRVEAVLLLSPDQ